MMFLSSTRPSRSQGSALILTVFILVVVAFLALMMMKNQLKVSTHTVTAVMGTRTNMAAQSAIQMDISAFYMSNAGSCFTAQKAPVTYNFKGDGLSQCRATVTCSTNGTLDSGIVVHQLESTAQCKFGSTTLQRIIEVGIRDAN
ncbi:MULTISPECIES: hypothetical protein [Aliivibrio]|uniref:hypothetical protein n=1 Tax=Aliivibrio TaxID=511678 RepID=UPI00039BA16E|nr:MULTISPECIES: hypothetical protein [Aliivibrio]MBB1312059.1 MSHA biogenesis protein MshP [Aliivibrio sp. SR45-2]